MLSILDLIDFSTQECDWVENMPPQNGNNYSGIIGDTVQQTIPKNRNKIITIGYHAPKGDWKYEKAALYILDKLESKEYLACLICDHLIYEDEKLCYDCMKWKLCRD